MTDEKKLRQAKTTFATLCKMLDEKDWNYDKNEEELRIESSARGDDLLIDVRLSVDADRALIKLYSQMPFFMAEEKRVDGAIAVCMANLVLVDGSFDYDISSGAIIFRLTSSFLESIISKELFEYMLMCSMITVDEFNDRFLMLSKGMLSLEDFLKKPEE